MGNLQKAINDLSQRKITRPQFFMIIGSSVLGMAGFFRLLQIMNTPEEKNLTTSDEGLFGEREYGHVPGDKVSQTTPKKFDEDVFG